MLSLRYDWPLLNQPSHCNCGHVFSIDHVLSYPMGGFPSIRHNEVRDVTASMLSEVFTLLQSNHTCSRYLENHCLTVPLTQRTMPDSTSLPMASGEAGLREHFLMLGYSILALDQIAKLHSSPLTDVTNKKRNANMIREYEKLNIPHSLPWYSLQLEV